MVKFFCDLGFHHDDWRTEDKFLIPHHRVGHYEIYAREKLPHLTEAFPERTVNSIYFETQENEFLRQSVDGDPFKIKLRFRWYGPIELDQVGRMEIKLKWGSSGIKFRSKTLSYKEASGEFLKSLSNFFPWMSALTPKLLVSYRRAYYQSLSQDLRLTLDSDIHVAALVRPLQLGYLYALTPHSVCEVKQIIKEKKEKTPVFINMPLRKIKFSKYDQACKFLGL